MEGVKHGICLAGSIREAVLDRNLAAEVGSVICPSFNETESCAVSSNARIALDGQLLTLDVEEHFECAGRALQRGVVLAGGSRTKRTDPLFSLSIV